MVQAAILALRRWRREDEDLKASLNDRENLRQAWMEGGEGKEPSPAIGKRQRKTDGDIL